MLFFISIHINGAFRYINRLILANYVDLSVKRSASDPEDSLNHQAYRIFARAYSEKTLRGIKALMNSVQKEHVLILIDMLIPPNIYNHQVSLPLKSHHISSSLNRSNDDIKKSHFLLILSFFYIIAKKTKEFSD